MRGDAVVHAARQEQLHYSDIVVVNILFIRISKVGRFIVRAFAQTNARRNVYEIACVVHRAIEIRLQDNADIVEAKLRAQSLENVNRRLSHIRSFHVDAHKIASARNIFDDTPRIAIGHLRIDFKAELRQLDRDI